MRTVAASEGIVIAAGMSGKIKTVLQMIAVPMLLLVPLLTNIYQENMGAGFLSQELYHAYGDSPPRFPVGISGDDGILRCGICMEKQERFFDVERSTVRQALLTRRG